MLLSHGADSNFVSNAAHPDPPVTGSRYTENYTQFPLMRAACRKAPTLVNLLLKEGADINQTNSVGQTALHGNCISSCLGISNSDVTSILLGHQVDVNLRDGYGRTALHYACRYAKLNKINFLLEAGAHLNIVDGSGLTELQLAAQSGMDPDFKVQRLLESSSYPTEDIIEAYETLAWPLLKHRSHTYHNKDNATDFMFKATTMREKNNLPKTAVDPLECYGFAQEWVTMDDLVVHSHELQIQSMLAIERIYKGRHTLKLLKDYTRCQCKFVTITFAYFIDFVKNPVKNLRAQLNHCQLALKIMVS